MKRGLVRSLVDELEGYVPGEQPEGGSVIKLNTNENPYPPSPAVGEVLRGFDADRLRLYPDPMVREVRRRLGEMYGCSERNIFAANGSDEVLELCTRAFVDDGGRIGFFNPSYSLYPVLSNIRGVTACAVDLGADFGWREPDITADLFFLACPNAPTANGFSVEKIDRFASRFDGVVVIDEAYAEFAEADCVSLALERDNVIVSRTLSKSYALAGIRFGYAMGPEALINALFKIKDSYNVDAVTQAVALAALKDRDYMLETRSRILATRARLETALARDFEVRPSQANFLWVRPRVLSAQDVFQKLKERNILVRYFPGDVTGAYLRITVGTEDEADRLLDAIGHIAAELEQ